MLNQSPLFWFKMSICPSPISLFFRFIITKKTNLAKENVYNLSSWNEWSCHVLKPIYTTMPLKYAKYTWFLMVILTVHCVTMYVPLQTYIHVHVSVYIYPAHSSTEMWVLSFQFTEFTFQSLRVKEIKWLGQSHTVYKWEKRN